MKSASSNAVVLVGALLAGVAESSWAGDSPIDLSGRWSVRLDPDDVGVAEGWQTQGGGTPIDLPGIATEAGLGEKLSLAPEPGEEVFSGLHQRFKYVGPAWYTRTFTVPDDEAPKAATLLLERVIWESSVWINGKPIGTANSLSTPHRYDVAACLVPGENRIAIRIDNRSQVDIGEIGHAYTDWTQTIWNGVIGRLELQPEPLVSIDKLTACPQPNDRKAIVRLVAENHGSEAQTATLRVQFVAEKHDGPNLPVIERELQLAPGSNECELAYPIDDASEWSEFDPALYRVVCGLPGTEASVLTGIRRVETAGRQLLVNDRPTFLRGTLECCIFPETGYPPTTVEGWDRVFATAREFGLNHIRFHSWCPPDAAFESADRHGVYVQVELPNWTFKMGQLPEVDAFLEDEGERILAEYGHHPSLILFSLGNELTGDLDSMDRLIERLRSSAPHLLFTSTSYAFSERGESPGPADDFFITQKSKTGWVRGQGFLNQTKPNTQSDYRDGLKSVSIPLISHEVGQYHVYPDLAELPRYNGNLRALNFEAIASDLESKGRREEAAEYTSNSCKLAAALYKEDIERALRTSGLSGIQLLDLHDFSGQGTATVGLLNAFWGNKGAITAEDFRRFCGPVTPLLRTPHRTWRSDQTFTATVELANFGETPLTDTNVSWSLSDERGRLIDQGDFAGVDAPLGNGIEVGTIQAQLASVTQASRLTLNVSIDGTDAENSWQVWVYPTPVSSQEHAEGTVVIDEYGPKLFEALAAGERVLFLPNRAEITTPLDGRFVPVFWSPVHFANQPGSNGAIIDAGHPALSGFPTDSHVDWQWWELLAESTSVDLDSLGERFPAIFRFIDKFTRNARPGAIWEARVGRGRLLVCTLDIQSDLDERIVARQLRDSLMNYLASDDFAPEAVVSVTQLASLFQQQQYEVKLSKGSAHSGYPLTNLDDGDRDTFWHTDWTDPRNAYPYQLELELAEPIVVSGLDYSARPDKSRGRVRDYRVEIASADGGWDEIAAGTLTDTTETQHIAFENPQEAKRLRFVALSDVNGESHCAIAELRPVFPTEAVDVAELGLIEGHNTNE